MASDTSTTTAEGSSSTSLRSSSEATRPDPGPLPMKRGEIGYVEQVEGTEGNTSSSPEPTLPARHPADRDASQPSPAATTTSLSPTTTTSQPSTPSTPSSALVNPDKTKKSRLEQKCFGGLILGSLLAFIAQFIFCGGTIAGWVLVVMTLNKPAPSSSPDSADSSGSESSFGNSVIFVHVLFVVASLGQLLFLERRIWRLRAERYNHLHPGEVLPVSHRRRWLGNPTAIAFSPWNRPPLPTYAAALRESGSGTGDVEDHMIAVPPPPAYGNTRGSRLLLTGFLRDSLRARRPPSVHSQMSQRDLEGGGSRPTSYRSKDEEWEEIQDADRARRLEETLARLERPTSRN